MHAKQQQKMKLLTLAQNRKHQCFNAPWHSQIYTGT